MGFKWFCALLWNNLPSVKSFFGDIFCGENRLKKPAREGIFMQCDKYIHKGEWCHNESNLRGSGKYMGGKPGRQLALQGEAACSWGNSWCFFLRKHWGSEGIPSRLMTAHLLALQELKDMPVESLFSSTINLDLFTKCRFSSLKMKTAKFVKQAGALSINSGQDLASRVKIPVWTSQFTLGKKARPF